MRVIVIARPPLRAGAFVRQARSASDGVSSTRRWRSKLVQNTFINLAKFFLANPPSLSQQYKPGAPATGASIPSLALRVGAFLVSNQEISMPPPLGYLITWTTYGTWLPGDQRGWVELGVRVIQSADRARADAARARMTDEPVILDTEQRTLVEATIRDHCEMRQWQLHAINARSNHVHVVVTAPIPPEQVMNQFKAWCSRRLSEQTVLSQQSGRRKRWWTRFGSTKWINDEEYLRNAIRYVMERQG